MLERVRAVAPAGLVPLAWTFATAAHLEVISVRTTLIGHTIMATLLLAFAVLSWRDMATGVLRRWRTVVLLGAGLTVLGIWGLVTSPVWVPALQTTVAGWMALPAVALWATGRRVETAASVYRLAAVVGAVGTVLYVAWATLPGPPALAVAGFLFTGLGQTAGILAAVRYHRPT
ncbi:MAG: hypothetical protein ABEJ35_02190 [Halobacteriaceae archaeon]